MKNKRRELFQLFFLAIVAILPWFIDFSSMLSHAIKDGVDVTLDKYIIINLGRVAISIVLVIFVLVFIIRKNNKDRIFNESGNCYYNHSYMWYWLCSKILGYQKCSLVRVPTSMQFKLLLNQVFREYTYGDESNYIHINNEEIIITTDEGKVDVVNVVLADTYIISKNMLPNSVTDNKTVLIERKNTGNGNRYVSENFCKKVQNTIYQLIQSGCNTLNIFPTTNAAHNIRIVQNSFMKGGRGDVKHIYVFSQPLASEGDWRFSNKGEKIR